MPLGCIIWDPNSAVQEWNQSAEKIFGWPRPSAPPRYLSFWFATRKGPPRRNFGGTSNKGRGALPRVEQPNP
jgi:PAS domain-containing protein